MSPQRSNRAQLIEGTLRCLERLPPERVTARAIADESGANLASITYHFGSKDELVTEAVVAGLDRWLAEIGRRLDGVVPVENPGSAVERLRAATAVVEETRREHEGLARTFLAAMAKALHDERIQALLAEGFRRSRQEVARVLGLGPDPVGRDAGGLALALFDGLLFQALLDPGLAIEGERMARAQARLRRVMPSEE
ncbi:TetR/AcrR family transcriptional regulator [Phytohabitans sp. LJ34]|uniref:TetR/AcrR family transcriptional regulator n=1 Tax=Phytohabitans sp. LJ34 TaxID=3452217 RepID=UPI003F8CC60D